MKVDDDNDVVLKACDGAIVNSIDAVRSIRQRHKDTMIICTNIASGVDALRAIEAGASFFQLSTMAYISNGPGIAREIKDDLQLLITSRGHKSLLHAVGKKPKGL